MKLEVLFETTGVESLNLKIGDRYLFQPPHIILKDHWADGFTRKITIPQGDGSQSYNFAVVEDCTFEIEILPLVQKFNNKKIVRVRVISGADNICYPYNTTTGIYFTVKSRTISSLPGFKNFATYSPEDFFVEFNRVRFDNENGIVGHIKINSKPKQADNFSEPELGKEENDRPETKHSKIETAIQIYKQNQHKPRKEVLKLIATALDMTENGASSYYSHAKRFVTTGDYEV